MKIEIICIHSQNAINFDNNDLWPHPIIIVPSKMSVFILYLAFSNFLSVSASFLTCTPFNFICPDSSSVISCECQAAAALRWTVTSLTGNNPELLSVTYSSGDNVGPASSRSMNGYTVVLCDVDSTNPPILTSTLNFAFTEDVNVVCLSASGNVSTATIQAAGNNFT